MKSALRNLRGRPKSFSPSTGPAWRSRPEPPRRRPAIQEMPTSPQVGSLVYAYSQLPVPGAHEDDASSQAGQRELVELLCTLSAVRKGGGLRGRGRGRRLGGPPARVRRPPGLHGAAHRRPGGCLGARRDALLRAQPDLLPQPRVLLGPGQRRSRDRRAHPALPGSRPIRQPLLGVDGDVRRQPQGALPVRWRRGGAPRRAPGRTDPVRASRRGAGAASDAHGDPGSACSRAHP